MDYFTNVTAKETVPCFQQHFLDLAAAMNLEVSEISDMPGGGGYQTTEENFGEDGPHGFSILYRHGELFLFAEENGLISNVPEAAWKTLGTILKAVQRPYLELGIADYGSRDVPGSAGGGYVRITDQGELIEPSIVWP